MLQFNSNSFKSNKKKNKIVAAGGISSKAIKTCEETSCLRQICQKTVVKLTLGEHNLEADRAALTSG